MPGVKGRSGGSRPGAGRPIETFALKRGRQYGLSIRTEDGHFLPMQLLEVVEVDRKAITFKADNGDLMTLFR